MGITGIGMVLVAAFTLRALKRSFFSGDRILMQQGRVAVDPDWNEQSALESITLAEKMGTCLLILATLTAGLYPKLLLDRIIPAVQSMRFLQP